jgi:ATP-dependent RNA helicase DeaD
MNAFKKLGIEPEIIRSLSDLTFSIPTPVQQRVIPLLLAERIDLITLAQTGTGKTAAFGIPLLQRTDCSSRTTQALILCPTRELCIQVAEELQALASYLQKIDILPIYGGASLDGQIKALRRGAQIIVATPGRLQDLINRRFVDTSQIETVVLDEADEMLQMGFQEEIDAILTGTPAGKNTLLFSATMPRAVAGISKKYMRQPREITIGQKNSGTENVEHLFCVVKATDRFAALKRLVDINPELYAIIFCRTKKETKEIADKLMLDGYNADALHGDLSQSQRDAVMKKFRCRNITILVATDVAARGLDVNNLTHVINYNLPDDVAVYTHRSGRTGRAGKTGKAVSIIHLREKSRIAAIERQLHRAFKQIRVPSGPEICRKQLLNLMDSVQQVEIDAELEALLDAVQEKLINLDREELVRRFIALECNRLLRTYRNAPDLNVTDRSSAKAERTRRGNRGFGAEQGFVRLQLNVGKNDGIHAGRLIGEINELTEGPKIRIGRIDIADHFSVFEAESRFATRLIDAFASRNINGKPVFVTVANRKKIAAPFGCKKQAYRKSFDNRPARKAKMSRKNMLAG